MFLQNGDKPEVKNEQAWEDGYIKIFCKKKKKKNVFSAQLEGSWLGIWSSPRVLSKHSGELGSASLQPSPPGWGWEQGIRESVVYVSAKSW